MSLSRNVHPLAEAELLDAVRYYELLQEGLGRDLDDAVATAVDEIEWSPHAWPKFPGWDRLPIVRSRKVEVFPYRVVYLVRDGELVLIAFAHQSGAPLYWARRVDG